MSTPAEGFPGRSVPTDFDTYDSQVCVTDKVKYIYYNTVKTHLNQILCEQKLFQNWT